MAATVEFIGTRIATIDSADAGTNVTAVKMAGGGGGPSETAADTSIQGGQAVGMTYPAANRFNTLTYDIVTAGGTALDFSPGGTEGGQLLYVWANALFPMVSTGNVQDNAYGGLGITLSDDATITNSWANWTFYGSETYPGGWVRLCIDPTLTPTSSGGTWSVSSLLQVRKIGLFYVAGNNARADALVLDAIDVGSGLRVYGTSTTDDGFQDIIDYDDGTSSNRYGVIRPLEASDTVINLLGTLEIGDPTGTNSTNFTDINKVIVVESPQYLNDTQSAFVNSVPDEFLQIKFVGNTTGSTDARLGIIVSGEVSDEDTGRNGVTFLGNLGANCDFIFNENDNVDSLSMYGCTLRNFQPTGGLIWDATANHNLVGSFIDNCSKLTPDSGVRIRNTTFLNHPSGIGPTGEVDAAVLYKTSPPDTEVSDIRNSSFVSNYYAVEHADSGTYQYNDLSFSANTVDIYYSNAGVGDLVIQASNSNPNVVETGNPSNTVTIENTVTLTLEDVIADSEVRIYSAGTKSEVFGTESSADDGGGIGDVGYSYQAPAGNVDIRIFHLDYQPLNLFNRALPSNNSSIPIQQIPDRNYENPGGIDG